MTPIQKVFTIRRRILSTKHLEQYQTQISIDLHHYYGDTPSYQTSNSTPLPRPAPTDFPPSHTRHLHIFQTINSSSTPLAHHNFNPCGREREPKSDIKGGCQASEQCLPRSRYTTYPQDAAHLETSLVCTSSPYYSLNEFRKMLTKM